jgi:hypothetical protein
MRLEFLRIVHLRKGPSFTLPEGEIEGAFHVDSCLRKLWVCDEAMLNRHELPIGAEVFSGVDAYAFLLRIACGLESQIQGETDIFGQLKQAWKNAKGVDQDFKAELHPWMQRLFEDTKDIRSQYIQNLGGASYGSLVRKILARLPESARGPVLLVGAGKLAHSIAPYVLDTELWIANRSAESLDRLHRELLHKDCGSGSIRTILDAEGLEQAFLKAAQAVICVPFDAVRDARWIDLWKRGGAERPVVHMGGLKQYCGEWVTLPCFSSLTEVFELENNQSQIRQAQLARAGKACLEKAKLRALGGSTSIPHGWEDLAIFA